MAKTFSFDFTGKVAVITGGSGVLCSEFARALAASGAKVAILNRNLEAGQALADEINGKGGIALAVSADVLDEKSLEAAHEKVVSELGKCDILINGAGGNNPMGSTDEEYFSMECYMDENRKSFFDLPREGFEKVFGLNITGTILTTQCFAKDMLEKGGSILNISSMNAYTPLTKIPAYSSAKAALSNLTQWMAVHFSKVGIRVNAIAPGFFSTKQNAALLWNADGTPTARTGKIIAATPMDRFGKPEELIGATFFLLCEEAASFVTGVVIPVDGGFSAYSGV